jgi:hypothetical protein
MTPTSAQRLQDLRRHWHQQKAFFKQRAKASRLWRDQRDHTGAAGPCKRLDPATGELVGIVPATDA